MLMREAAVGALVLLCGVLIGAVLERDVTPSFVTKPTKSVDSTCANGGHDHEGWFDSQWRVGFGCDLGWHIGTRLYRTRDLMGRSL